MKVYLDNSGTTKAYDEVGDLVRKVLCEDFGNPSSMHYRWSGIGTIYKRSKRYVSEDSESTAKRDLSLLQEEQRVITGR